MRASDSSVSSIHGRYLDEEADEAHDDEAASRGGNGLGVLLPVRLGAAAKEEF